MRQIQHDEGRFITVIQEKSSIRKSIIIFHGSKEKSTHTITSIGTEKALGKKFQETILIKTFNKTGTDEPSDWVLSGKQKVFQKRGLNKGNW